MKEKIRLALINKYKNLGFSDKAIDGILAYLEATVTEESGIDDAVSKVEGMLKAFQSEVDTRVTTAVNKAKQADPAKQDADPKKEETPALPTDAPEYMKTLLSSVQALTSEVSALKAGKSADTRRQTLATALKDVSEPVRNKVLKDFDRMQFATDEDFNTYLDETKTDVGAVEQSTANSHLSQQSRPFQSAQATKATADADIASWAKTSAPAPTATAGK